MLKPLFDALAAPGLGNPHTPYEMELMAAGVKPVAIVEAKSMTPAMRAAVESGAVVLIGEQTNEYLHRIHCRPDQIGQARHAARILSELFQNNMPVPDEELPRLKALFVRPGWSALWQGLTFSSREHDIQRRIEAGRAAPEIDALLNGRLKALPPFLVDSEMPAIPRLDDALARGAVAAVDINHTEVSQVFAQASRIEEGKELFSRYLRAGEGQEPLAGQEGAARIARLLGYTENDIGWHYGTKYRNPLVRTVMEQSSGLRLWARKESMLLGR